MYGLLNSEYPNKNYLKKKLNRKTPTIGTKAVTATNININLTFLSQQIVL